MKMFMFAMIWLHAIFGNTLCMTGNYLHKVQNYRLIASLQIDIKLKYNSPTGCIHRCSSIQSNCHQVFSISKDTAKTCMFSADHDDTVDKIVADNNWDTYLTGNN